MFNNAAVSMFANERVLYSMLGFLNSSVSKYYLKVLSPTLNSNVGDINRLPYNPKLNSDYVIEFVSSNILISKNYWDSRELSWGFTRNELILQNNQNIEGKNTKENILQFFL